MVWGYALKYTDKLNTDPLFGKGMEFPEHWHVSVLINISLDKIQYNW